MKANSLRNFEATGTEKLDMQMSTKGSTPAGGSYGEAGGAAGKVSPLSDYRGMAVPDAGLPFDSRPPLTGDDQVAAIGDVYGDSYLADLAGEVSGGVSGGAPKVPKTPKQQMDAYVRDCENYYGWICHEQHHAIEDLKDETKNSDAPSLADTLLEGAVQMAVAAGFGAVGKLVQIGVLANIPKMENGKRSHASQVIAEMVKQGTTSAGKQIVGGLLKANSGNKDAFWISQRDGLFQTAVASQSLFVNSSYLLENAPDGLAQAKALKLALKAAYGEARAIQRTKTLDEWANCLAMSTTGGGFDGDPNAIKAVGHDDVFGALSIKGVLNISVGVDEPGDKPWIKSCHIHGLEDGLRKDLAKRPLGEIRITKNIHTELWGAHHDFAILPSGKLSLKSTSAKADDWLAARAKLGGQHGKGRELLVNEDMKDLKLHSL